MNHSFQMLVRRFSNDSLFWFINFVNLGIGFAGFILLSQFISSHFTWDKHNLNYDRIYRVQLFMDQKENAEMHTSSVPAALSRHILTELPEIEKVALIHDAGDNNKNGLFLSPDKKNQYLTRYGYYADQSVLDIFTFEFIEGKKDRALEDPYSILISESLARKLFPAGKAMGRQVYIENKPVFTVTGVYRDLPVRSTWLPVFMIPMVSFATYAGPRNYEDNYWAYGFNTYVLLRPNADARSVDAKIYGVLKDYREEHHPYLRQMSKLYINPYFQKDLMLVLGLCSFIALLILILSSFNYINLQTANATSRFREIGIKKAVGFTKSRLWLQFMAESVFLAAIAALFGLIVAQLAIPAFNRMIGMDLLTGIFSDGRLMLIIAAATLATGILSGFYPALAISSFNPVTAIKQKFGEEDASGSGLKTVLVTLQFSISIFLILVSMIVYRQTQFMLHKDMGFDSRHVLFANIITNKTGSFETIRRNLLGHSEIAEACISDYIPFILPGGADLSWEGGSPEDKVFVRYSTIGYDFIPTYNLKLTEGRNFSRENPADGMKCLVNETALKVFGWKEGVGKYMHSYDGDYEVIGVIRDYVVFSVHNPLEPHFYRLQPDSLRNDIIYSVRFVPGKERKARQIVADEFERAFPDDAFEFRNIQDRISTENAYLHWKRFSRMCLFIAVLSVLISSMGLFGLILFVTRRKMKEIAVRKVLGFSFFSLYFTLSSGFAKMLLVSILLAWPASYYVYRFLPGANKFDMTLWEFPLGTLVVFLVAMITISFQTVRAARSRPADILKYE